MHARKLKRRAGGAIVIEADVVPRRGSRARVEPAGTNTLRPARRTYQRTRSRRQRKWREWRMTSDRRTRPGPSLRLRATPFGATLTAISGTVRGGPPGSMTR